VLQDTLVEQYFYVSKGLNHDCLLGSDFFANHGGTLDFANYKLSFDENSTIQNSVTVSAKVVIPSCSKIDVVCSVNSNIKLIGTVMVEPLAQLPISVSVASSVAKVSNDRLVFVRMINSGLQDVTLKPGLIVGTARKIAPIPIA
jgi:hypothetical protein